MAATPKQIVFITSLVNQRYAPEDAQKVIEGIPFDSLTGGKGGMASSLIDKLMAMPKLAVPGTPPAVAAANRSGTNSSRGACFTCGHAVDASAGFYYGPFDGEKSKWRTHHKDGECSTDPAPTPIEVVEGFYLVGNVANITSRDFDLFAVYTTKNGRLAGKKFSTDTGKFEYQAGALSIVATGRACTTNELAIIAAKFGEASGNCMFCRKELTDDRSNPLKGGAGYGPTCASKHGLPWG